MFKINTIRRKLIVGLAPGFLVLVAVTAIGYLGLHIQAEANAAVLDTGVELDALKSLQLSMQQALMPPNDYLILGAGSREREQFELLTRQVEERLSAVRGHLGEEVEQRLLNQVVAQWHDLQQRAEAIFDMPVQPLPDQAGMAMEALDASAAITTEYLQELHDLVHQEMVATVERSAWARRTAHWLLLISAVLSVAGGLLFTALFSRHLTDPIVRLRIGAARIGAGELDFRLDIRSNDELGTLAAEFNRMAERLQDLYAHLEDRVAARTAQLHALDEAGRAVASELELDKVLHKILDLSLKLSGASRAGILVPCQVGGRPRFLTASSSGVADDRTSPPPEHAEVLRTLMRSSQPIRLTSNGAGDADTLLASQPEPQHFLGVPIVAHGETIGALYMTNPLDGQEFSQEDAQLMTMLAAHAAVAIENARLYGEIREMNEALEARVRERTAQLQAVSEERTRYAEALRLVLERTVRVQEEERHRIAKDMHDGVSQWLMGALYEIQAAKLSLNKEPDQAVHNLDEAQAMLKRIKDEMRRVIYDLHPPILESNGLVAALRTQAADFQAMTGLPCQVRVVGTPRRLPAEQELALYRIVQEALHNAAAHAAPRQVQVMVEFGRSQLALSVADDGRGFSLKEVTSGERPHLGLLGMHERAYSIGGKVSVESALGQGSVIRVELPLESTAECYRPSGNSHNGQRGEDTA